MTFLVCIIMTIICNCDDVKHKHQWFSGKIQRCHRWAPSSILGWCIKLLLRSFVCIKLLLRSFVLLQSRDSNFLIIYYSNEVCNGCFTFPILQTILNTRSLCYKLFVNKLPVTCYGTINATSMHANQ